MEPIYKIVFDPAQAKRLPQATGAAIATGANPVSLPSDVAPLHRQSFWGWIVSNWRLAIIGLVAIVLLLRD